MSAGASAGPFAPLAAARLGWPACQPCPQTFPQQLAGLPSALAFACRRSELAALSARPLPSTATRWSRCGPPPASRLPTAPGAPWRSTPMCSEWGVVSGGACGEGAGCQVPHINRISSVNKRYLPRHLHAPSLMQPDQGAQARRAEREVGHGYFEAWALSLHSAWGSGQMQVQHACPLPPHPAPPSP